MSILAQIAADIACFVACYVWARQRARVDAVVWTVLSVNLIATAVLSHVEIYMVGVADLACAASLLCAGPNRLRVAVATFWALMAPLYLLEMTGHVDRSTVMVTVACMAWVQWAVAGYGTSGLPRNRRRARFGRAGNRVDRGVVVATEVAEK